MRTKNILVAIIAIVVAGAGIPAGIASADFDRDAWGERIEERKERLHERMEERRERIEERRERIHERVEERKERVYKRVCKRFERLSERFGTELPHFCEKDDPEPEEPTLSLTATPGSIEEGASSLLEWETENTESCEADWTDETDTSGSESVSPNETTEYEMTCEGEGGAVTKSITVIVTEEPEPVLPTVALAADPDEVEGGATSTLSWSTSDADMCIAGGSAEFEGSVATSGEVIVAPTATTTYTLECGNENGTTTDEVLVGFVPIDEEPEPTPEGTVVISELVSDPEGSDSGREWVEIFNGTDSAVDLADWKLVDTMATDTIATTSTPLPSGSYAVVVTSTSSAEELSLPAEALILVLEGATIGNGLGNSGDALWLVDETDTVVDAVSWGDSTAIFDPAPAAPGSGESLARIDETTDTDAAADWEVRDVPTPGE